MLGLKVLQMSVNFSPKSDHPSWYFSKKSIAPDAWTDKRKSVFMGSGLSGWLDGGLEPLPFVRSKTVESKITFY